MRGNKPGTADFLNFFPINFFNSSAAFVRASGALNFFSLLIHCWPWKKRGKLRKKAPEFFSLLIHCCHSQTCFPEARTPTQNRAFIAQIRLQGAVHRSGLHPACRKTLHARWPAVPERGREPPVSLGPESRGPLHICRRQQLPACGLFPGSVRRNVRSVRGKNSGTQVPLQIQAVQRGRHHHQALPVAFSLGIVPAGQRRHQDAHRAGP